MPDKETTQEGVSPEKKISIQEALDKAGEQLHISELQALNIKDLAKLGALLPRVKNRAHVSENAIHLTALSREV